MEKLYLITIFISPGKDHQKKQKLLKYNPSKSNQRTQAEKYDAKYDEELTKIVSHENQDVCFSLNKKQRWEIVEKIQKQEKNDYKTSVYTETVKYSKNARFRAKFKKRDDFNTMQAQVVRDPLPTPRDIIIEQNAFLLSTDKEKYRLYNTLFSL